MIQLSTPNLSGNEWKYIKDCLDTNWVSSVGEYVNRFENITAQYTGAKYAIATSNGTAALHISLILAGVQAGDLVIAPNITFVATINAIKYTGANPILFDCDPDTWQIDLDLVEDFLKNETLLERGKCICKTSKKIIKAIVPVHVLGNMCNMHRLKILAQTYNLEIVEDSTEALGSIMEGKHAGTFGLFGTLSYNGNKLITTGGGGMILTNDESLARKAKHLTTTAKSDPKEYFHDQIGYNYRLVNILAAMGVAQMEHLSDFLKTKEDVKDFYNSHLENIPGFQQQKVYSNVKPNNWLYTIRATNSKDLMTFLREKGIEARPFWVPMSQLPPNASDRYVYIKDNSSEVYKNCISLPCSTNISSQELETVVSTVLNYYEK